jgi:small conductance mechanosensitive channel
MPASIERSLSALFVNFPNVLIALIIFIGALYLARITSNFLHRVFHARHVPIGTAHLLSKLTSWAIVIFGIFTALQRFFDVTAFLAGLGLLGLTIGFALQDTIKNLAGGIILLVQQPIQIGEEVGAAGFDGTVLNVNLRTTEMETTDGRIVILPNSNILAGAIINYTRAKRARVSFKLSLPKRADALAARQMVMDVIQGVPGYVSAPAPQVVFDNLNGRALEMTAGFWIDLTKSNAADARDAAIVKVTDTLLQAEVSAPPRRRFLLATKQK